ncbi:MAG: response regulator [Aridibacter sp.]
MPAAAKTAKRFWRRALSGEKFTAEQSYTDDFHGKIYYEATYNPILDEGGQVIGVTQIARDITLRHNAIEETEGERNFVSAVVDVSSSLVIVLSREGRIIKFNKACENLTGFKFEEVQNKIYWEILVPSNEVKERKNGFRKIDKGLFDGDYINHIITKDEELRLISWKVSSIKDENQQIQFVVSTGIDIAEKEEFEKSRDRMLAILENSKDFIGLTDIGGRLKYTNPAGRNILGLNSESDISRLNIINYLSEESANLFLKEGLPQAIKKDSWIGEVNLNTENGEIPLSLLLISHKNNLGNVEFLSVVARDISDLKNMEQQLSRKKDFDLAPARSNLDFLANISHEIRTPLNGVVGLTELLLNSRLDDQQKDLVETIRSSGETLLTMTNDILDFSKVESGTFKIESVEFELRKMIEEVINLFSKNITDKKLDLLMVVYNEVPQKILGDPVRLRQILINLVGNALKFTDVGEVIVRVRVLETVGNQIRLKFSVKDTGIGIEPDAQANLFEAFVQADETITAKYGGTGLGLAISKNLINLMNGEIGLISEPGSGSDFWFLAEFKISEEYKTAPATNNFPPDSKILIVDKNKTAKQILLYHSKSIGIFTEQAETPIAALNILKKAAQNGEPFKYVLLDEQFFSKDGLSLAEDIKKSSLLKHTSIALMLRKNKLTAVENEKINGISTIIYKPIKQSFFQQTLKKLLGTDGGIDKDSINSNIIPEINSENSQSKQKSSEKAAILIAEDNLINQKVILNQISDLGYKTDIVRNGNEVIEALKSKKYDLILMDCQMPLMDGFETTAKIRESNDEYFKQIPIVAVTAQTIMGIEEKCHAAGMTDYISKPTNQQELKEVLNLCLNKSTAKAFTPTQSLRSNHNLNEKSNLSESKEISKRLNEISEFSDDEVVVECIELFLNDSVKVLNDLVKAYENSNYIQILREAHKLKGSSANMGAVRLPELCQELISEIREDNFDNVSKLSNEISKEYNFLESIYKNNLQKFKSKQIEPELVK